MILVIERINLGIFFHKLIFEAHLGPFKASNPGIWASKNPNKLLGFEYYLIEGFTL